MKTDVLQKIGEYEFQPLGEIDGTDTSVYSLDSIYLWQN